MERNPIRAPPPTPRAGCNNNLLTSYARKRALSRAIPAHARAPRLTLCRRRPFDRFPHLSALSPYGSRSYVSRNCHLSSRRFTVSFRHSRSWLADIHGPPRTFGQFISARSLVYPRRRDSAPGHFIVRGIRRRCPATHIAPYERSLRARIILAGPAEDIKCLASKNHRT